ncbi:MAG TPA: hypothetical protein PLQ49_01000 [Methanothrix sp.]|nr:hypothetical protein [Methanothrix sp.]HRW82252.1 hypothetical protein [Methanothrix sp.]
MDAEKLWFSKLERQYSADLGQFRWTDEQRTWDWTKLTSLELVMTRNGTKKLILRREGHITTKKGRPEENASRGKDEFDATLRYMLGIDIDDHLGDIKTDYYTAKIYNHKDGSWDLEGPKKRWSFQIGDDAWLWQWADDDPNLLRSPLNAKIGEVHKYIKNILSADDLVYTNIFDLGIKPNSECCPVIYQPAVDGMKNFIREIHRSTTARYGKKEVEVTIVFNNEELRRHKILNRIYEQVRNAKYGRLKDIESFVIMVDSAKDKANGLRFEKIYSGHHDLVEDTIHGDAEGDLPPHRVRYYADDYNHPIIFINTSNHAMAEHDTNPDLWKWEYVPWSDDRPFVSGKKSRDEVNRPFKSLLKRLLERFT